MPRIGVRSIVTYALTGAIIAAMFVGVPITEQATVSNAAMLALGFFFAKASNA